MSKATVRPNQRLDPERWKRLKEVMADALEGKSRAERAAVVEKRCSGDDTLLAEAESLLQEAEAFLKEPTDSLEDCAEQATVALWQEDAPPTGWRIGSYVVVRELGRGGMGTVYLCARADGQFEKEVAIKVLKRGTDTDEVLRRFAAERHILARLDHANIARLLDAGTTDDGLPYFVMEYVAGAPVTRFVRDQNLSVAVRLALFLKICAAVEVAHRNHIIHRDLKPSNILVNTDGEPKLLDFGIAKLLVRTAEDPLEITAAGEERLTPNCASPEQTDGRPLTETSDVYALGALLYELLTRHKPHKFTSSHPPREEIVRVIREEEPALPSTVVVDSPAARALRGDLDAIVTNAMRKEPGMRYQSVTDFAADLRRHLAGEPVLARRASFANRTRTAARSRTTQRIVSVAAVILFAIAGAALWKSGQIRQAEPVAQNEVANADSRKSIAVLPFDNFGTENPSYFADGIQDNILTDLGKVRGLKVMSRNAVAVYRGKEKNARQIGRDLGVGNVLVGSVQPSGDRVRINAQLIDTRTDTQVWAEHYDRKVEDLFALQSELAQTIVAQLQATLSSGERAALWKQPTQDLAAYDLYLRARAAMNSSLGPEAWREVVDLASHATARDPNFASAYCILNEAHLLIYRYGNDHSPERLASAKEAAETALRLDPQLEQAQLALANYYYNGLNDYRRTDAVLSKIVSATHPVEYFAFASLVQRRLGKWEESIRDGKKAIELDPQNAAFVVNLCQTLSGLRRFAESTRICDEAIARLRRPLPVRLVLAKNEAAIGRGDLQAARAALDEVHDRRSNEYDAAEVWLALLERDYATVKAIVGKLGGEERDTPSMWLVMGAAARADGNAEEARYAYSEAKRYAEAALARGSSTAEHLGEVAAAEAGLGRKEEALHHAHQAAEMLPVSVDALLGPQCIMRVAEVEAIARNSDGAIEALRQLVKVPFGINSGDLKLNPLWDILRDDPRFEQISAQAAVPF